MNRAVISNLIRNLKLMNLAEILRFKLEKFKNRKINSDFRKNTPDVLLPPDYLMYESFLIEL